MIKNKKLLNLITFLLMCIFLVSCSHQTSREAEVPIMEAISQDISTPLNNQVTIIISASNSDEGELSYQWYCAADKLTDGKAIENENANQYTPDVSKPGTFFFYCVVTNTLDNSFKSIVSPRISVTVEEQICAVLPTIIEQPQNFSGQLLDDFVFKTVAYSSDAGLLSYCWYYKTDKDAEPKLIENANESTYSGIISEETLGCYYCIVTNEIEDNKDGGIKSVSLETNTVYLSNNKVNVNAPQITAHPLSATVFIPSTHSLIVGTSIVDSGTLSYQWYSIEEDASEGILIEGAKNSKYEYSADCVGKIGFYCLVTNTIDDNGDGGKKSESLATNTAWLQCKYFEVPKPTFIKQPNPVIRASYNQSVPLSCEAEAASYDISYQWYETATGLKEDGVEITATDENHSNTSTFITPAFTTNQRHYYYCVASTIMSSSDGNRVETISSSSDIVCVAYSTLPLITITTVNGEEPKFDCLESPTGWGNTIKNATKVPSRLLMTKQNETLYDSGEYVEDTSGATIKVRGNTSAYGHSPHKVPYKIKLQKKADLLNYRRTDGKDHKDKNWILLKDGVTFNTAIALNVAKTIGFSWVPEYEFVDVVINNDYKGVYLLIESIEKSKTRINVKDSGYIIERDAYWFKEDYYFETPDEFAPVLKYTFKYPDKDITEESLNYIKEYVCNSWSAINNKEDYTSYVDLDSFAKWILVHDLLGSSDAAGSNIYISKNDNTENSKLKMETPWDFDSIYNAGSYENQFSAIHTLPFFWFPYLFEDDNFSNTYKQLFLAKKNEILSKLEVLYTSLEQDFDAMNLSRSLDSKRWEGTHGNANWDKCNVNISNAENWFTNQISYIETEIQ